MDVDIASLVAFHRGAQNPGDGHGGAAASALWRLFMDEASTKVTHFEEKPAGDGGWINGGSSYSHRKCSRTIDDLGADAARSVGRATASCAPTSAYGFLARHGHHARQGLSRGALADRAGAVEDLKDSV